MLLKRGQSAVVILHEDLRGVQLAEDVFAANLWSVVCGTAPEVYLDPSAATARRISWSPYNILEEE
jgi:hypothetical protein